jgi:hypothetical protein
MPESGSSWQQRLPGRPEFGRIARRWVVSHVNHPYADVLAAELWATAMTTDPRPDLILMTVSTVGRRVRITAHGAGQGRDPAR